MSATDLSQLCEICVTAAVTTSKQACLAQKMLNTLENERKHHTFFILKKPYYVLPRKNLCHTWLTS